MEKSKLSAKKSSITNPDKIFWPEEGYSKLDLINYYKSIAPIILPYLKDRPESLNRFPNGIKGKSFFQKNVTTLPEWVQSVHILSESEHKNIQYVVCQNEASLIYLINLGCIELHPWLSRVKKLEYPDFCVLDLDPEHIEFEAVVEVATIIHNFLNSINIENYCKTSGATGLHVCIPLGAKYTYDQSRQFAQLIATMVHRKIPKISSIERSPSKRQGKVYIDYLQNRYGQTIVSPYAVRPRKGAPVSTPLLWSEVKNGLDPTDFTIKTIFKRIKKLGDIWQPVIKNKINLLSCLKNLKN